MNPSDDGKGAGAIAALTASLQKAFGEDRRIIGFDAFLSLVQAHPTRYARNSAQYLLDALDHFGVEEVVTGRGSIERYALFDAEFSPYRGERVVGNEATQAELVRALKHCVRERRINRLILVHGPNGSAKSSLVSCLMRALEAYSRTDEGALYRFSWVFPTNAMEAGRIGFDSKRDALPAGGSYALLDESQIDSRLPSEHNDNPLFLLPRDARESLLTEALSESDGDFVLSDTIRLGDLGHRSRAVFDALLASYRGDFGEVMRHVQVERFFISKRYRRGAVTVEPQLRVDASARQLTVDRSLNALPRVLQSQTLFEPFGPLVEGNRGVVEYNDMLKRPMDANKYLLATSEKGTVALDTGEMHIDAILIATANEKYLEAFKAQPDWASYKGRFSLVRMPYLLDYVEEQKIYDAQLDALQLPKDVAPHTTFCAALWAVLTRLIPVDTAELDSSIQDVARALTPLQKAQLYADGLLPDGLTAEQAQQLRLAIPKIAEIGAARSDYEGRFGASPREIKTVLLDAAHQESETLSPLHVFGAIRRLIADPTVYEWLQREPSGAFGRPEAFIDAVQQVYLDRVEKEVHEATGLVDPSEYQRLFERYITNANHSLRGEKLKDPVTGNRVPPDEQLMDDVESQLGRDVPPETFRSLVISRIAAFRIDHPDDPVDLERIFPDFFARMRDHYFGTKQAALMRIKRGLLVLADDPERLDPKERDRVESTLRTLEEEHGYTLETAKEAVGMLISARDHAG